MPNRLAQETSPYLLQHQNNPVDWYPWGPEAIEKARREEKPIFLSIGYSACHWCHVMEHESFEDEEIARKLNENFVAIKVDREERPDLDQIYMNAVQMLTGHGGWPMSVFLTPDLKPFYGGTYWPPRQSRGMPGFDQILAAVADAWTHRREQALAGAENFTQELQNIGEFAPGEASWLSTKLIDDAVRQLRRAFDANYGGFGQAPKFPHPMDLQLLLRAAHREGNSDVLDMVRLTLDRMGAGGIYDHLGGGFARYSVDARWLVPHFEKMLYDNALLGAAYADAYQVTGDPNYSRIARETLDYILRDMTDPRGGFHSTEDADSEGHEGLFYTWTPEEIAAVLGAEQGATFARVYDVTPEGNFEGGRSILNLPKTLAQCAAILGRTVENLDAALRESRRALFEARENRVRPGRDDKVIVAWNGLMIDTMARAGMALGEAKYIEAAAKAADFILAELRRADGRLLHTWRGGQAKLDAYLDDYAALANSLVTLYEATFDERYLAEAKGFIDTVLAKFADPDGVGFFYTASDHEELIARTKELTDSSTPSGNALAVTAMLRLGRLLGSGEYLDAAEKLLTATARLMEKAPLAAGQMLLALDRYLGPSYEFVLIGEASKAMNEAIAEIHRQFLPRSVIAARKVGDMGRGGIIESAFAGKNSVDGQPTLYLCQNFVCEAPIVGVAGIATRLADLGGKRS